MSAVNCIHFWLLDASIVLGIGIPTDYVQVQSLAKLAFRCFNWEGKIFYTPENQTYGTSKCTHEKKNKNIYIQTMISCIQGEFCRDVNILFPCLSYAWNRYTIPFVSNWGLWKVLPVDSPDPTKRDSKRM